MDPEELSLEEAVVRGDSIRVLQHLSAGPRDLSATAPNHKCSPIHLAAAHGHTGVLALLSHYCNVNLRSLSGGTPLHYAALNDRPKTAELLLQLGADPDAIDSHQNSALMLAAYHNCVRAGRVLLARGADTTLTDKAGRTALRTAVLRNSADMATLLSPDQEALDICGDSCLSSDAEAEAFARTLATNNFTPHNEKLSLSGSSMSPVGASFLASALKTIDTVKHLTLSGVLATTEHAEVLCAGLEENFTVTDLDLSGCGPIGTPGFRAIGKLLAANRCLRRLDVSHAVRNGAEGEALGTGFACNYGLEDLELGSSTFAPRRFGGAGFKAFLSLIRGHHTLTRLGFSSCAMTMQDINELASALASPGFPKLRALNLSDTVGLGGNEVCDFKPLVTALQVRDSFKLDADAPVPQLLQNARRLHQALGKLRSRDRTMFDLNIVGCIQRDADALNLVEGLHRHGMIASLNIAKSRFSSIAARSFADLLVKSQSLKTINLGNIDVQDEDRLTLVHALAQNRSIKSMTLSGWPVSRELVDALCDCLTANTSVEWIKGMPSEAASLFEPYLQINRGIQGSGKLSADSLFRCVRLRKLSAVPALLAANPKLDLVDANGTFLHPLLLQEETATANELCAVYRCKWHFDDETTGRMVRSSPAKFAKFANMCCRLAESEWVEEGTRRNVLHCVLEECRFSKLPEKLVVDLVKKILKIKPVFQDAQDASGQTPAEVAACCPSPNLQHLFMVGIISALQRRGRALKAAQEQLRNVTAEVERARDTQQLLQEARAEAAHYRRLAEGNAQEVERRAQAFQAANERGALGVDQLEMEAEVEIECVQFDHLGVTYWLDEATGKVYTDNDDFVGKLTAEQEIDFGAIDSDAEDSGIMDDSTHLPVLSTHHAAF